MDAGAVAEAGGISAWQLLVTSATPTLIVCILASVGAALAHKVGATCCHLLASSWLRFLLLALHHCSSRLHPAAPRPQGVLDARGCQLVARLGFMVYTPALTFSKLTQAVSLSSIRHL